MSPNPLSPLEEYRQKVEDLQAVTPLTQLGILYPLGHIKAILGKAFPSLPPSEVVTIASATKIERGIGSTSIRAYVVYGEGIVFSNPERGRRPATTESMYDVVMPDGSIGNTMPLENIPADMRLLPAATRMPPAAHRCDRSSSLYIASEGDDLFGTSGDTRNPTPVWGPAILDPSELSSMSLTDASNILERPPLVLL